MARKSAQIFGRGLYLRSYGRAAPFPIPVRSLYYLWCEFLYQLFLVPYLLNNNVDESSDLHIDVVRVG